MSVHRAFVLYIRGEDGKFFIIATDLSVYGKNNWTAAAGQRLKRAVLLYGKSIVNWSEASLMN